VLSCTIILVLYNSPRAQLNTHNNMSIAIKPNVNSRTVRFVWKKINATFGEDVYFQTTITQPSDKSSGFFVAECPGQVFIADFCDDVDLGKHEQLPPQQGDPETSIRLREPTKLMFFKLVEYARLSDFLEWNLTNEYLEIEEWEIPSARGMPLSEVADTFRYPVLRPMSEDEVAEAKRLKNSCEG
jgi:hypothetical protein